MSRVIKGRKPPLMVRALALTAEPFATVVTRVFLSVFVPSRAVRLDSVLESSVTAAHVLGKSNQLKMIGIDAVTDTAEMIPSETSRRLANENMVGQQIELSSSTATHLAVAVGLPPRNPYIAAIRTARIDLAPEAYDQGSEWSRHSYSIVLLGFGRTRRGF